MKINIKELFTEHAIEITDSQVEKLEKYYEILVDWNNKLNLTAITEYEEVLKKHFLDSIYLIKYFDFNNKSLLDVGSGAGFPSLPLKIMIPSLEVTIIDALKKRISFLEVLTKELDINADLIHGRAEEFKNRNYYDFVTARAVARLNILSELCLPFVKVGGLFLPLKGPKYEEELEESVKGIKILGGKYIQTLNFQIDDNSRSVLKIEKVAVTNKIYPRQFGKIKSKPL